VAQRLVFVLYMTMSWNRILSGLLAIGYKGGLAGSDTSTVWHLFVFDIIPGFTAGYLLFGLCLLNVIVKTKKAEEESNRDA
jgi:hypothetical protein